MVCSDDPGPGEADEAPRLGQGHIAQAGEAGGHAAGGGVGEVTDEQAALFREGGNGGAGFGHLHQAENALLHPRAAAGGEDDERQAVGGGVFPPPG